MEDETLHMLRDSARGFLGRYCPVAEAVELANKPEALRSLWKRVAEQGWTMFGTDTEVGGLREALIVMGEMGRAACPLPLPDALVTISALHHKNQSEAKALVAELIEGTACVSLALGEAGGESGAGAVTFSHSANGQTVVNGVVRFVEGASIATHILVALGQEQALAIVKTSSPGVTVIPTRSLAQTNFSDIRFENTPATPLQLENIKLNDLVQLSRLTLLTRSLGAAERMFEMALEHAKTREAFGSPIGRFQAIQHKLANCKISLTASRLLMERTAKSYDAGNEQWQVEVVASLSYASPALKQVSFESHHVLGGIGYWEEHEAPRHFRRIQSDMLRFGGASAAQQEFAEFLLA